MYALDLPGHGRSNPGCLPSIKAYAASIATWIKVQNLDQVILVGHSMGSAIALNLAFDEPQYVVALGLLGSSARFAVNPKLIELLSQPETLSMAIKKITRWSFSVQTPETLTSLAERRLSEAGAQTLQNDFHVCSQFDISKNLDQINQPALLVCGQEDQMTPVNDSIFLAKNLPNSRLELILSAGHMVMLEKPLQVASLLKDFIFSFSLPFI